MSKEILRTPEDLFKFYKVIVDHDGVMADTRTLAIAEINETLGTDYTVSDINGWHWVSEIAQKYGMKLNEAHALEDKVWYDPDFLIQAKPLAGAYEFMKWFYERSLKVPVATSRNPELRNSTMSWYEENMPFVDRNMIFIRRNYEFTGEIFKVFTVGRVTDPAIHFEDSVEQARLILDYTNVKVALLSNSCVLNHRDGLIPLPADNSFTTPTMMGVRQRVIERINSLGVAQY